MKSIEDRITIVLEEYGMPEFKDKTPAIDIIQIMRDGGYIHKSDVQEVLDVYERGYRGDKREELDENWQVIKTVAERLQ